MKLSKKETKEAIVDLIAHPGWMVLSDWMSTTKEGIKVALTNPDRIPDVEELRLLQGQVRQIDKIFVKVEEWRKFEEEK